jgi:hypothetical protein
VELIIFSAPMVRAILAGRKTQTRRVIRPQPMPYAPFGGGLAWCGKIVAPGYKAIGVERVRETPVYLVCPLGKIGDRLWVREWWTEYEVDDVQGTRNFYAADYADRQCQVMPGVFLKWQSPLFMPRRASRITLEITEVRVECVQDLSWPDAIAEGIHCDPGGKYRQAEDVGPFTDDPTLAYRWLWDSINGNKHPWSRNPWVRVLTFKVL